MVAQQGTTRTELGDVEVARLQLVDINGRVERTTWARADRSMASPSIPLRVTIDHIHHQGDLADALAALGDTAALAGVVVHLHAVRVTPGSTRDAIASAAPRGNMPVAARREVVRALRLDTWCHDQHGLQHWRFPRLVVGLEDAGSMLRVLDDPGTALVDSPFATCVALEDPEAAGRLDLWWPRDAPVEPVRAYQWMREEQLPPVTAQ